MTVKIHLSKPPLSRHPESPLTRFVSLSRVDRRSLGGVTCQAILGARIGSKKPPASHAGGEGDIPRSLRLQSGSGLAIQPAAMAQCSELTPDLLLLAPYGRRLKFLEQLSDLCSITVSIRLGDGCRCLGRGLVRC